MATNTPKLGLRKPATTDLVNVLTDLANNFDILDNAVLAAGPTLGIAVPYQDNKFGVGAVSGTGQWIRLAADATANCYMLAEGSLADINLRARFKGNASFFIENGAGTALHRWDQDGKWHLGGNTAAYTATSATAGGSALPATPANFIVVDIAGTNYKIPFYNS
jgi:hypothetical protein